MGDIIDLGAFLNKEPDIEGMNKGELLTYLKEIREKIARLDAEEPEDMESETYEDWGDLHEELEDLCDDILDRLDELS